MKKKLLLFIIIFNSFALLGIIFTQVYWVREAYLLKGEQFAGAVRVALKGVANQMHAYLSYNYLKDNTLLIDSLDYLPDIRSIDAGLLDFKLNEEFNCMQVGKGYEYAIININDDTFITGNYKTNQDKLRQSHHQIKMAGFKDADSYILSAYFPDENNLILKRMVSWIILSVLFSMLVILAYFYTVFLVYRQKRLSEVKEDFTNNMTHEFKTPLATISLASEMLMKKSVQDEPARMQRYARIIYDENTRLQNHVEQILRVSQLEKGKFRLRKKATDVHELINKVLETFEITMKERNGDLKYHLCAKNFTVMADPFHLTNVITNLLDNANKYSTEAPEIKIGTYNDSQGIIISVEDHGIGIGNENQHHIFKNLYRVPTGNIYNREKGFGIGLYYVKTIIEAHGGHIKLKSELGKGSRFDIFLPYLTKNSIDDHEESQ